VKNERHGLEIVMPRTKVPEWFDYRCKEGIPCLWVRGEFPINVALALAFQYADGKESMDFGELHLVINGQRVPHKGYYSFDIEEDHFFVCDLRPLYNDEEWISIDALLLKHEWNQVQISYEIKDYSSVEDFTLREWGVFVYKQGTVNWEEHVQFTCPTKDPMKMT
ncbi:TMV resistance protein N-like, partial [Trifolium medium]|nr:TMV resistance protein N-like [Trifolium medium]